MVYSRSHPEGLIRGEPAVWQTLSTDESPPGILGIMSLSANKREGNNQKSPAIK
jgi:hypothetical protein